MSKRELIERLRRMEAAGLSPSPTNAEDKGGGAEKALRDSGERLRAIVNTAVEGIITIDDRGIIESVNPSVEKMFGYQADELIGQNVSLLMPEPHRSRHNEYIAAYLQTGKAHVIGLGREVPGRRKNGEVFPMELSVAEVRLTGARLFTGILRDITTRKEAEIRMAELAQSLAGKNKELETMVYAASHDLRSPLVNIQGFSQELAHACAILRDHYSKTVSTGQTGDRMVESILKDDIPEAINYILGGVRKMDALLSGFLRFSRLGRATLHPRAVKMNQLVREVIRSMDFEIKSAGARVEVSPLPDCFGDPVQINQVFSNLMANALKYRDPLRPLRVCITGEPTGAKVTYKVTDNGMGMATDHQGKIFEIFHRLNPAQGEGEGLGLTIAQRIVELHQGTISVESEEGVGSTFAVRLARPSDPNEEHDHTA